MKDAVRSTWHLTDTNLLTHGSGNVLRRCGTDMDEIHAEIISIDPADRDQFDVYSWAIFRK